MAQRKNYDPRRSSIAVGGEDGKKKRGLLPLLLGLLALIALLIIIGLVSCNGDDDKSASTSAPAASAPAATTTPPADTTPPAATGTLTAGADDVLGSPAAISDHVGDPATGAGLKVLSLAASGSGFFVGTDESDQQYVEYGSKVGQDESDQQLPKVGDVVGLKGEVRPAPKDAARTLKLTDAEAKAVDARGAYVNATEVTPAG